MTRRHPIVVAALLTVTATASHAQGIPVIDIANLVQTVQQVVNDLTKINNQIQQITQLQTQITSMNGMRMLGTVANNPSLRNLCRPTPTPSSTPSPAPATVASTRPPKGFAMPA